MTKRLFAGFPKLAIFKANVQQPFYRSRPNQLSWHTSRRYNCIYVNETLRDGDYLVLVNDYTYHSWGTATNGSQNFHSYFAIPLKSIESGKIKPTAAFNWKERYKKLPLVTADEVTIIDEDWVAANGPR